MRFNYDGDKIKALRKEALYSRELLARMARTTMTTVIKAESKQYKTLDDRTIEGIAIALGVHPNVISPDYYPPTLPYVSRVRYDREMLRARRKALGLTLAEVADAAGVSLEAVHHLEYRKDTAKPETVRRICRALGLRPQDVSPTFNIFPSPDERDLYSASYGHGVFAYPEIN